MLQNIIDNPNEAKFKQINLSNEAFKKRVSAFAGGLGLLKAAGFQHNEEGNTLDLASSEHIQMVIGKIDSALQG